MSCIGEKMALAGLTSAQKTASRSGITAAQPYACEVSAMAL